MASKKPIQSKSLWFNTLSIMAMVGGALLADQQFREIIGTNAIYVIIAVNIINMIIRSYTIKPISMDPDPSPDLNPVDEALRKESEEYGI